MKRTILYAFLIMGAAALLLPASFLSCAAGAHAHATVDHGFSVKEYEAFHDVLHPLEHEALPQRDFKRIRSKASELVTLGEAIVKLGVPRGVEEKYVLEFRAELKKFDAALVRFKQDAQGGSDEQLKASYSAVHDSFEMLAALLPRKSSAQ